MYHKIGRKLVLLESCVAAAVVLLFLAALLPQKAIHVHLAESAGMMQQEGLYPRVGDRTASAQLDNFTDALILMETDAMNISDWRTVFTNPIRSYTNVDTTAYLNPVDILASGFSASAPTDPVMEYQYTRYWMGFRSILRLALVFVNAYQMKRYLALLFFGLFLAVTLELSKRVSHAMALLFGMVIALMRPEVICASYQFSSCFLIAFAAMLMLPLWQRKRWPISDLFLLVGAAAMYLDFYTVPLVTFGLPFIYLYLLEKEHKSGLMACFGNWCFGYLGMWFFKMLLSTPFAEESGFQNGVGELLFWVKGAGASLREMAGMYLLVPIKVVEGLAADKIGAAILAAAGGALLCFWLWKMKKAGKPWRDVWMHKPLLAAACFPLVLFLAAPTPIMVHYWFQYRSLAVTFFGIGAAMLLTAEKEAKS